MRTILTTAALCIVTLGQTTVFALDLPSRKPGLWETTMHMGAGNALPRVMKFCIDSATDAAMFEKGMGTMKDMCSKHDMQRNGNVITSDAVCKMGESTMTSHSVITFTGDSAYQANTNSHFEPPMMKLSDSVTTQDAKWTGPCPSDMAPGDMIIDNGPKHHTNPAAK